ncbi:MBL fold metallo-hydrolase [Paenibacillus assamensis]|uniref:MBL fold metallo-hydrolase n=1 Tax=Paenibacillus assamensis TaxID=311244 RepID=UPI00040D6C30|nr:MBL fold metallo-hydrolase [Paenibacillus assamensis]
MLKLELLQAIGSSYYLSGKLSVGVYLNEANRTAVLIDSGPNAGIAKALDRLLRNMGYSVSAIINTHAHVQQYGGNYYFQETYPDIRVYSSELSAPFIQYPWLGHSYGAAETLLVEEEKVKHQVVVTDMIPYEDRAIHIDGAAFTIVTLPGHSPDMIGVITPDNVLYGSDALFGKQTLMRQKLLYYNDIKSARATFNKLSASAVSSYVFNHGGYCTDISELVHDHFERLEQCLQDVEAIIRAHAMTYEQIVKEVLLHYEIEDNSTAYMAISSIVRALLNELKRTNKINCFVEKGQLVIKQSNVVSRTI